MSSAGASRIVYQPALDGVRALAVIAVLLFHAGTPGFGGGYLGVSVFFTLSGFLITTLLINEHDQTGRIDLGAFYGRRLRRLLPASLVTIALIVVLAATTDLFVGVPALRTHVLGATFQVANWVFLAGEGSYQDLLAAASGTASPLEHFWSLAIEEQFYWVWPVCMLAILGRARRHRSRVVVLAVLTAVFAAAAPVIAQVWGPDAAYWSTPARLSEILVGALLAMVLSGRALPSRSGTLAPIALVLLAAGVFWFPSSSGPAYEGALPLVAVVSGMLLVGLQSTGAVRTALSTWPFVQIGRISYGLYLYHWPIYVILDAERVGVDGLPLTLVRLATTLAVSYVSFVLVEQPIRRANGISFRPTVAIGLGGTVAVSALAVVAVPATLGEYWRTDDALAASVAISADDQPLALVATTTAPTTAPPNAPTTLDAIDGTRPDDGADDGADDPSSAPSVPGTSTSTTSSTTTLPPIPELARPVRIVVTGDSTANALGAGVVAWAAANPELAQVEVVGAAGCGFLMGGERRFGDELVSVATCEGWVESQLLPVVERTRPDVVVVMMTTWDVVGRRWDDGDVLTPLDPEYRRRIEGTYDALVETLVSTGAGRVAFVRQLVPDVWWSPQVNEEDEPERHQVVYDVYASIRDARPEAVDVVSFDRWFSAAGLDRDTDARPDGVHLAPEAAERVMDEYLGEQFVRAALGLGAS